MSSPYISQITMFGGNFAPKNYALCNGQILAINQNAALFSLARDDVRRQRREPRSQLPNLQSALPMSFGQGAGLSNYVLGQTGGVTCVTLTSQTVPSHQHFMMATKSPNAKRVDLDLRAARCADCLGRATRMPIRRPARSRR